MSEAKRLTTLEDENRQLKKLLPESMPANAALKNLRAKENGRAHRQDKGVAHLRNGLEMSERRGLHHHCPDRKMIRHRSCRPPDVELRVGLRYLAIQRRKFGYHPGAA